MLDGSRSQGGDSLHRGTVVQQHRVVPKGRCIHQEGGHESDPTSPGPEDSVAACPGGGTEGQDVPGRPGGAAGTGQEGALQGRGKRRWGPGTMLGARY